MKKLLALALVAPLLASADVIIRPIPGNDAAIRQRAIRQAQEVRLDLQQLAQKTQQVALQAASNGNEVRARRFREVAARARNLAADVQRELIRPLRAGERLANVGRNLDRLMPEVADLGRSVSVIQNLPAGIENTVRQVVLGVRQLQSLL